MFPCYHIIHQLFKFPQFLSIIFKHFAAQSGVSERKASISTQERVRNADLKDNPDLPSQNLCDRKFSSWFTGYQCLKNTILTFYKTVLFINFNWFFSCLSHFTWPQWEAKYRSHCWSWFPPFERTQSAFAKVNTEMKELEGLCLWNFTTNATLI